MAHDCSFLEVSLGGHNWGRVSLHSPSWSQTHSQLPTSSQVLGITASAITASNESKMF